jgi:hypothetical protein
VYDRLNSIDVSMSYVTSLNIAKEMKRGTKLLPTDHIRKGNVIRIIGDNVSMRVGVKEERQHHHGKMLNYFGSVVLVNDFSTQRGSDLLSDLWRVSRELFYFIRFEVLH